VQRRSASNLSDFTCAYDGFGQQLGCVSRSSGTTFTGQDMVGFSGQFGGWTDNETDVAAGGNPKRRFALVHMGHREYAPLLGRFLTRDPIDYEGGINLYAYAGNNPITGADPSGLQAPNNSDEDEFPVDESGRARPYRKAMKKVNKGAKIANKAITIIAEFHPFSPLAKAYTGKGSDGKALSKSERIFNGAMTLAALTPLRLNLLKGFNLLPRGGKALVLGRALDSNARISLVTQLTKYRVVGPKGIAYIGKMSEMATDIDRANVVHFNLADTSVEFLSDLSRFTSQEWNYILKNSRLWSKVVVYNVPKGVKVPKGIRIGPGF